MEKKINLYIGAPKRCRGCGLGRDVEEGLILMMMKKSNVMDEKELRAKHRGEAWRENLRKAVPVKERVARERVKMPELDPKYRVGCNDEVNQGLTVEMAMAEAARCLDCPDPQCITGCPVGN